MTESGADSQSLFAGRSDDLHGILNINKPSGMTSHDVVLRVRRCTGQRKVGHAGTLDPLATGVLLICLGQATRLTEYLMAGRKIYRAVICLGITTDTYDATGSVIARQPVGELSLERIGQVLASFEGAIQQRPPAYSAIRQAGRRLYRLARQGVAVQTTPRPVYIEAIRLIAWQSPRLTLEVTCSAGTYIRSLAHDIGQQLGVGGHVAELSRLASGDWRIEQSITLEQLEAAVAVGDWHKLVQPMDGALRQFEAVHLAPETAERVAYGQTVVLGIAASTPLLRAYAPGGRLLALLEPADGPGLWRPTKVFLPAPAGAGGVPKASSTPDT